MTSHDTKPRRSTGSDRRAERKNSHYDTLKLLLAIRAKCVDCSGGSRSAVAECTLDRCALHRYRLGQDTPKPA